MKIYAVVTVCENCDDEWWYGFFESEEKAFEKCDYENHYRDDRYRTEVRVYDVTDVEEFEPIKTDDTNKEYYLEYGSYDVVYPV